MRQKISVDKPRRHFPSSVNGGTATTYTYTYVSGTAASNNPFKYRGYYYDEDLGLYMMQERVYLKL